MPDRPPGQRAPLRPNRPQLLTYPDSLGGTIRAIAALLRGPLDGAFSSVHILPPFPSSGDRGFAPLTYDRIEPAFGSWVDIEDLARTHAVLLDVMVNHISRHSPEFRALLRDGPAAATADLFITPSKVWPSGDPPAADIARLFLRRSTGPFSTFSTGPGDQITVWTTFGEGEVSEQVDLDLASPAARALVERWLAGLASHGVSMVRLDAVGYVVKKAGTTCFMVEPEIWDVLAWATEVAGRHGLTLLPEVHDVHRTHEQLTAHGLWTYDFVLPGLVLHSLTTGESGRLASHLASSPERQVTTLDCHDGIPIRPDLEGILAPAEMRALADLVVARGGNVNRILSRSHAPDGVDVHQLNITYFSALGEDEERYLAARAIQLFARGIPQVYYVGLLAGSNDAPAVESTREGRAINRHDYDGPEITRALARPVARRLLDLVRLRNTHPAFDGEMEVSATGSRLHQAWSSGRHRAELVVDLAGGGYTARATTDDGAWSVMG
ncbi:MAG TPA: sucrose phosphorylase [Candidatus Limnocylindrales bacterium]|nr:sucrose phosphorylase [Candidatus Limnocylindrales bacterium]